MLSERVKKQFSRLPAVTAQSYLAEPALVEAVEVAIALRRPLLLKGEPGCGKTKLAQAVAADLGLRFEPWYVKSTSRASDGLYVYDAVGRLRDAQLGGRHGGRMAAREAADYVRFGALGQAFCADAPMVVLIDEIDKADIDFPNDLLLELDEQKFQIAETGKWITARYPPIVIVTSNDEKELPAAFLRRCIFHYIEFPSADRLAAIVRTHFPDAHAKLLATVILRFCELREQMSQDKGESGKRVSTSELLDWFRILSDSYEPDEAIRILEEHKVLPRAGVLLKSWADLRRYATASQEDGTS